MPLSVSRFWQRPRPPAVPLGHSGVLARPAESIGVAALLACFLAVVWLNVVRLPAWEAPDEPMHVAVARDVAAGRISAFLNEPGTIGEEHQGPLYYVLAAPLVGVADGSWLPGIDPPFQRGALASLYALRVVSSLMALVTLASVYLTIASLFSNRAWALGTTAFTAVTPGFVLTSASANNDNAVIMFSALCAMFMARTAGDPRPALRNAVLCAAALSGALLSKITGMFLVAPFGLLIVFELVVRGGRRFALRTSVAAGIAAAVAVGIWLSSSSWGTAGRIRALLDGNSTLSPQNLGWVVDSIRSGKLSEVWGSVLTSYWGFAGWQTYAPLAPPVAVLGAVLVVLGCLGGLRFLAASRRKGRGMQLAVFLCALGLAELLSILVVSQLGKQGSTLGGVAHARYLFPAIATASLIQFGGTISLLPGRARLPAGASLIALVAMLQIAPTFSGPERYTGPLSANEAAAVGGGWQGHVRFSNGVDALIEVPRPRVRSGGALGVDLLWRTREAQTLDFTSFVHLVGRDGDAIVKSDQVPTLHRFPPRLWRVGDLIRDRRQLLIPESTPAGEYELEVGSYLNKDGGAIPIETTNGSRNRLAVTRVIVSPSPVALPETTPALDARFGDAIILRMPRLETQAIAGVPFDVTLYWQSDVHSLGDYAVSLQILTKERNLMAQTDGALGGAYRTALWQAGEVVAQRYSLALPEDWPAGQYSLAVAVYDPASLRRLPVTADSPTIEAGLLRLAQIDLP